METEETKITLGLIIGWILGVLVGIAGVGLLFTEPVPGIFFILLALVLLPPANRMLKKKFNLSLSGGVKVLLVIVLFGVAGATMDTETTSSNSPTVAETPQEVSEEVEATDRSNAVISEPEVATEETVTEAVAINESIEEDPEPAAETPAVVQDQPTLGERQAIRAAQNYINFQAFSKSGLIEQLEFEGYSRAEAEYGVANITVDWNEQAALSAQAYLEYSNFSRSGLIEQLEFEGYTSAQAQYGAAAVGY